ncbi:ClpXP protease specificity-enhancing factor [Halorhodospira abdelmalekii]|uniref:ClpXP protease specificity-enhancing factor n=1 Tax=Halorhodospira abdelmalekii TaxID=421629 RepID=UPI001902DD91|nr:ClpXP protease specificity-enhancing factor [Halorhodospira abdelmalekii]MBK1734103.1 ClpXP protease specificity-enhancing factor [Halorhodospira abdelmalekii]
MNSSRPYMIRAIYEWIADNDHTPYLLVDATRPDVDAPTEFAEGGRLVLNVSPRAVQGLSMGNEWIAFSARFGGVARSVTLPVGAVIAVYARENGQGMLFGAEEAHAAAEEGDAAAAERAEQVHSASSSNSHPGQSPEANGKPLAPVQEVRDADGGDADGDSRAGNASTGGNRPHPSRPNLRVVK